VMLDHDTTLAANSESIVSARVMFQGHIRPSEEKHWVTCTNQLSPGVSVAQILIPDRLTDIPVRILNVTSETVHISAGTYMADLAPVELCNDENDASSSIGDAEQKASIDKIVAGMDESVSLVERTKFRELLEEYAAVFAFGENEVGRTAATRHEIDTGDARPVRQRMRRQPPAYQNIIKTHVDTLLKQGIIAPAQSPWAANIVLVRKKDNTFRCCIDYRSLNDLTRKDAYSLPRTDVCLDALAGSSWFSTLDMKCSYHQVEMEPADSDKTAFICREGMFKYLTMPFGLCNAGATFQRLVDIVLSGLNYEICLVYIDDLVLFS